MKQEKKIIVETIKKQQERIVAKVQAEKEELEKALEDKKMQYSMQLSILEKM